MKQFEKHWNKIVDKLISNHIVPNKPQYKAGWRAAFELMLGWLDNSIEHKELADKIYEELEEK